VTKRTVTGTAHYLATTLPIEHAGSDNHVELHLQSYANKLWSDHPGRVWLRRGADAPESETATYNMAGVPLDKYASWPAAPTLKMDFRVYAPDPSDFQNIDFRLRLAVVSSLGTTSAEWESPKFTLVTRSRPTASDAAGSASASAPLAPPPATPPAPAAPVPAAPGAAAAGAAAAGAAAAGSASTSAAALPSDIVSALNSLLLEPPVAQSMSTLFVAIPAQYRRPLLEDLQANVSKTVQLWHEQMRHMLARGPQELELFTMDVSGELSELFADQSGSHPPSGRGASVATAYSMDVVDDDVGMDVSQLMDHTQYRTLGAPQKAPRAPAHYRNLAAPTPAKSGAVALVSKALARRCPPRSPELA